MFFGGWTEILRILIVGLCAYAGLVFLLRISGKRTLSKMNAFDFIVTVALGSTLATVLLSKGVALAEGFTAFALLIGLQWVVAWSSAHLGFVTRIVKSQPTLIAYDGRLLPDALRSERLVEAEVYAALRSQGIAGTEDIEAVVLETDGTISALRRTSSEPGTLRTVRGYPRLDDQRS
ncbi:MAG: DUF421 domain-containing protein [Myxococcales bacterium]|nr:DUF421 domain-containing protein [Myxococcales bacterium]